MKAEREYNITGNLNVIKNNLIDLELYAKFHPLIYKAEKIKSSKQGVLFQITERPYSWLPINVKYKALVNSQNNEIDYKISEIPFTKALINYKLTQEQDFVRILFQVEIKSKLVGIKILLNKMIDAQNQLMKSMQIGLQK